MIRGYLKLPRSNFDTKSYSKLKIVGFHQYLRLKACFYASKWQGVTLYPGYLATSLPALTEETGETLKSVRIILQALTDDGFIKCDNHANRFTIIKLLDYAAVQGLPCLYGFESAKKAGADQKADARADQRADRGADQKNNLNELALTFYDEANTAQGQTKGQTEGQTQGQTKGQHSENNNINNTKPPIIPQGDGTNENSKNKVVKPEIEIPGTLKSSPEFMKAWDAWIEYRKTEKRKPVSAKSAARQLNKMAGLWPEAAVNMINQSIDNDWTGLFPVRPQYGNGHTQNQTTSKSKFSGRF